MLHAQVQERMGSVYALAEQMLLQQQKIADIERIISAEMAKPSEERRELFPAKRALTEAKKVQCELLDQFRATVLTVSANALDRSFVS